MRYHLIVLRKYFDKPVTIGEHMARIFSDDETAVAEYEKELKKLALPLGSGTSFEITLFAQSREVKKFTINRPVANPKEPPRELVFA